MNMVILYRELFYFNGKVLCEFFNYIKYQFKTLRRAQLWKYRPFSRLVRGYKTYKIVRNYIQLNEKEARGEIKYQKKRLKGLSTSEWQILWA